MLNITKAECVPSCIQVPVSPSQATTSYKSLYGERQDLNCFEVRIQTFIFWPGWAPKCINCRDMANTGLYYTGDRDVVRCFLCKVTISDWKENLVPQELHRRLSPNCPFLKSGQAGINGAASEASPLKVTNTNTSTVNGASAEASASVVNYGSAANNAGPLEDSDLEKDCEPRETCTGSSTLPNCKSHKLNASQSTLQEKPNCIGKFS